MKTIPPLDKSSDSHSDENKQSVRLYPFKPTHLVEQFREHLRATNCPETFPTICHSRPPKDAQPEWLCDIDIDRSKRPDGDMAPCPICSPNSPKYLHGYLVWFRDEGVIRAIGHECGNEHFVGDAYRKMTSDRAFKRREDQAIRFLQQNLPNTNRMREAVRMLQDSGNEALRLHRWFKRNAPEIQQALRRVRKDGGQLIVTAARERSTIGPSGIRTSQSKYESVDKSHGALVGDCMVLANFNPIHEIQSLERALEPIPHEEDELDAFLWICDHCESLKKLEDLVSRIQHGEKTYKKICNRLDDVCHFFTPDNFARINSWGQDPDNPIQLKATKSALGFSIQSKFSRVRWEPNFEALQLRGVWPELIKQ